MTFVSVDSNRKNTRKIGEENLNRNLKSRIMKWRSETLHQNYSSKLIEALRRNRRSTYSSISSSSSLSMKIARGKKIRETADRVLAVTAKGTTRWSRSILASRRPRVNTKIHKKNLSKVNENGKNRLPRLNAKKVPAIKKKVQILGMLVPGCKKLSFPNLLDETSDYIAALEMQVRTMAALTELLTGAPVDLPVDTPDASA